MLSMLSAIYAVPTWVGEVLLSASVLSALIAAGSTILVAFRSMAVADRAVKVGYFQASIKDGHNDGYLMPMRDSLLLIGKNISAIQSEFQDTTNEGSLRAAVSKHRKIIVQQIFLLSSLLRAPDNKYQACCVLLSKYSDVLISELEDLEGFPDIPRGKRTLDSIQNRSSIFKAHLFELFQDCSHQYMARRINKEFPEVTMFSVLKRTRPSINTRTRTTND